MTAVTAVISPSSTDNRASIVDGCGFCVVSNYERQQKLLARCHSEPWVK
jgi:hypothetical protein